MLFDIISVIGKVIGILILMAVILPSVMVNTMTGGKLSTNTMTALEKQRKSSSPAPLIEEVSTSVVEAKKQE